MDWWGASPLMSEEGESIFKIKLEFRSLEGREEDDGRSEERLYGQSVVIEN